jgi:RHS repeat-associated protein
VLTRWLTGVFLLWLALTSQLAARYGGLADFGRVIARADLLHEAKVTRAGPRGLVSQVTKPSGQTLQNTAFDNEGHVLTQVYSNSGGTPTATVSMTYYSGGLLNSVTETDSGGAAMTTTRTYDDLNRLKTYSDGMGNTITYSYDAAGNLHQIAYPTVGSTTFSVTYGYDSYNRLTTVTDSSNRVTSYNYDLRGLVTKVTRPNGTFRTMVYDAAGQVRQIEERTSTLSTGVIWLQALRYDQTSNNGNFSQSDGEVSWTFTYPAPATFTLSADSASYDADNRLASWTPAGGGTQTPVFDADGNMTTGPQPNGSSGTYTYDTRNRLTSQNGVSYTYNPDGHRVQVGSTTYVVDPAASLSRVLMRNNGGTITYYVWGLGLLYEVTGSATKTYHFDHLGSTVALTDDSKNITDTVQYAPYGTVTNRTGSTNTPFLLHGALGVMSDSNGLAYMRARYYNPRLMRFVNADPIGFAGGMNAYAFGENNPTGFVDPSGLDPERGIAGMDFVSGTSLIPNEIAMAHEDGFVLNGSNYTGSQYALSTFKQDHPIMAFFGFSSMGESDNFAEAHGLDPLFALTGFAGFLEGFGGSTAAAEEGQMLYRGVPGNGTQKAILGEQGIAIPRFFRFFSGYGCGIGDRLGR